MSNPFPNSVPQVPVPAPIGAATFVDESDALSPTWWNGPNGSRVRYSMSAMWDDIADGVEQAIKARFPSSAPSDAFQWLTADRLITPGPSEPQAHLIFRLQQWLTLARYYGTNQGILLGISGYLNPVFPTLYVVNNSSIWYSYTAGSDPWPVGQATPTPPTITNGAGNWMWDGSSDPFIGTRGWWRSWVVVVSTSSTPWPAPTATWGSFHWGDGTALNWAGSQADRRALQNLSTQYKGAHTYIPTIIVTYSSSNFSPTASGAHVPDDNWGHWGKVVGGVYVSARNIASASYIDGVN